MMADQTPSPSSSRGLFVVLEGLDRSGKSTQCDLLLDALNQAGQSSRSWKFPGWPSHFHRSQAQGLTVCRISIYRTDHAHRYPAGPVLAEGGRFGRSHGQGRSPAVLRQPMGVRVRPATPSVCCKLPTDLALSPTVVLSQISDRRLPCGRDERRLRSLCILRFGILHGQGAHSRFRRWT